MSHNSVVHTLYRSPEIALQSVVVASGAIEVMGFVGENSLTSIWFWLTIWEVGRLPGSRNCLSKQCSMSICLMSISEAGLQIFDNGLNLINQKLKILFIKFHFYRYIMTH